MGWSDPGWNWGSANGDAHDEAMRVRSGLAEPAARQQFLQDAWAGTISMDEAKMALALKCQRARNVGYDSDRRWAMLMEDIAACKFEEEGGDEKLANAIRERLPSAIQYPEATPIQLVSVAMNRMGFVERGL